MRFNKFFLFLTLITIIIVGAVAVNKGRLNSVQKRSEDAVSAQVRNGVSTIGVEVQEAAVGTARRQIKVTGVLKGKEDVVIRSEIPGKIKEIRFTEGTIVKKGQELIIFEDDAYKANYTKAKAEYDMAKATANTAKRLLENSAGTRKEYEDAVARMNAAKAHMEITEYELSKTVIRAPFSGLIGIMKDAVGNTVQQYAELVSVVDTRDIIVNFKVPVVHIASISVGQFVDVLVESHKDCVFCGAVEAIDAIVDEKANTITMKAVIPNDEGKLRHGMFATVVLTVGEKADSIIISDDAIIKDGVYNYVWVVNEKIGVANARKVVLGNADKDGVEVVSGLSQGELVVTSGYSKLFPGASVKILNNTALQYDVKRSDMQYKDDDNLAGCSKNLDADDSKDEQPDEDDVAVEEDDDTEE